MRMVPPRRPTTSTKRGPSRPCSMRRCTGSTSAPPNRAPATCSAPRARSNSWPPHSPCATGGSRRRSITGRRIPSAIWTIRLTLPSRARSPRRSPTVSASADITSRWRSNGTMADAMPPVPVPEVDPARMGDPALRPIADKVRTGERLTAADGAALFRSPDLLGVGLLADAANRARHGSRVYFAANQHINPTNICILRKTCVFCSYARLPKEDGAYRYTMDQVWTEAAAADNGITREFHIVGGLDMHAGLDYYAEMFRGLKARHPRVHIKALTAVEIAHIARIEKMSVRDVLVALRAAGLDTMPGGGAEVFSPGVRATIADKKLAGEEWIAVHREAHRLGIRTNCTMLYGHVETFADRVRHLAMLRELQDETGGFLAYIPLAYHPDNNELGEELERTGTA